MDPVHLAAVRNDAKRLARLLDEDPGLLESFNSGVTPLTGACMSGSLDAARLLLDRGANADKRDEQGWTPFMWACECGRADMVALLLHRGADPCLLAGGGLTTLIRAAAMPERPGSDHVAVIRLLIQDGRVPVNARSSYQGVTALCCACVFGHTDRARVLLVEGFADPTIALFRNQNLTPLAAAVSEGHEGCIRLLQWYERELEKPYLLSKARAVVDATYNITKAADKARVKSRARVQAARKAAAPAWLSGRVTRGEALPVLEVGGQESRQQEEGEAGPAAAAKGRGQDATTTTSVQEQPPSWLQKAVGWVQRAFLPSSKGRGAERERKRPRGRMREEDEEKAEQEVQEEEREACLSYVLWVMTGDLFVELMEGLRRR